MVAEDLKLQSWDFPENTLKKEGLRNAKSVAFFHRGGLFSSVDAVDHREHFVRAWGGIASKVAIIDLDDQGAVADLATQNLGDIIGPVVQAIVGADDLQIAAARNRRWRKRGPAAVIVKLAGVDGSAFAIAELLHAAA